MAYFSGLGSQLSRRIPLLRDILTIRLFLLLAMSCFYANERCGAWMSIGRTKLRHISRNPMHFLFVCSENRLRSPAAEEVFSEYSVINGIEAGTNHRCGKRGGW